LPFIYFGKRPVYVTTFDTSDMTYTVVNFTHNACSLESVRNDLWYPPEKTVAQTRSDLFCTILASDVETEKCREVDYGHRAKSTRYSHTVAGN